jgi:hypothetical protein
MIDLLAHLQHPWLHRPIFPIWDCGERNFLLARVSEHPQKALLVVKSARE